MDQIDPFHSLQHPNHRRFSFLLVPPAVTGSSSDTTIRSDESHGDLATISRARQSRPPLFGSGLVELCTPLLLREKVSFRAEVVFDMK